MFRLNAFELLRNLIGLGKEVEMDTLDLRRVLLLLGSRKGGDGGP